jgi:peptide/nickel transport system ATP-binding protein
MEDLRGDRIAMIFQEPMTSLNPVATIGDQIVETLRRHRPVSQREAVAKALEMLALVRMPEPEAAAQSYPHQLSGGMRQRAMIAMALVCEPRVLIADEPTTALDVTIQAQILALLRELQRRLGMALLLITHDLGVVAEIADEVIVMYAGRAVEAAPAELFFDRPLHPYTHGLMRAMPRAAAHGGAAGEDIPEIPGVVPPLWALPPGCAFAPRCAYAQERCRAETPALLENGGGHRVACLEADRIATAMAELVPTSSERGVAT